MNQKNKLDTIEKEIRQTKQQLMRIGEMRPGSLSRQNVSQYGKKYPYYQISYTYNMKSRTDYIKNEFVDNLGQETNNYKRFKRLVKRWVDLAMRKSKLKIDLANKKR